LRRQSKRRRRRRQCACRLRISARYRPLRPSKSRSSRVIDANGATRPSAESFLPTGTANWPLVCAPGHTNTGEAEHSEDRDAVDARCRHLVQELGVRFAALLHPCRGWRSACGFDVRSLALMRETLAWHDPWRFAFAMQVWAARDLTRRLAAAEVALPAGRGAGTAIAAFALSERRPAPTSPRWNVTPTRRRRVSIGRLQDLDLKRALRTSTAFSPYGSGRAAQRWLDYRAGHQCFVVDADAPGLHIEERIDSMAPHPLAMLRFTGCRIPVEQRLGPKGGFKLALRTLDIFRTSVAAPRSASRGALWMKRCTTHARAACSTDARRFSAHQGALADMAPICNRQPCSPIRRMAPRPG